MIHLPQIVQDLALILMAAAAMTLLFRAIKQPVVLGYIIAGFLVGPHFTWTPSVLDTKSVTVWAEIGVIFLLFALGLEFSFKKLARVGSAATITALVEVVGMVGIGFVLGQLFGWNSMDSLFLGGILAISSTTIIIRAFDELGMKTRGFVALVFGALIVEDLFAILLMVLLSTVAVTQTFSGIEMGVSALKLVFFLTLWFVSGIFLIPSFLKRTKHLMKAETLLVVSLGLCFFMVVLASKVGFSPALGAFIMGSILAETMEGERIEHLIVPVKDLFAAVFFVSVGMLIDPAVLVEYKWPVLIITVGTIIGKIIATSSGALLSGQSLRHSVQAGMSLAQIGEFSFIIAALGLSLKVTSDFLYPIAISVSAVTTFTTPYLIKSADPFVGWLERTLPNKLLVGIEQFGSTSRRMSNKRGWKNFLQLSILKVFANGVVVTAIFLVSANTLKPWVESHIDSNLTARLLSLALAFLFSSPFLWAMAFGRTNEEFTKALWKERIYKAPIFVFEASRWVITLGLVIVLSGQFISAGAVTVAAISAFTFLFIFLYNRISKVYFWLESRFMVNLNEKELLESKKRMPTFTPWDAHLVKLKVSQQSDLIGKKISEAMIRERFGISVAVIERGRKFIPAPSPDEYIYPMDTLQVLGSDEEIHKFREVCEVEVGEDLDFSQLEYSLHAIQVESDAFYAGKSIRDSGIGKATSGLVVGIEKNGQRNLNPDSSTLIEVGDTLWIVGNSKLIQNL